MTKNHPSPKFTDAQLLAYLDGATGPDVAAQIEASPADRKRAQDLARMQRHLTFNFYRIECPKSEHLGEYLLGFLSRTQSRSIETHLRECPHCKRELAQLRDFMGLGALENGAGVGDKIRTLVARLVSGPGGGGLTPGFAPAFALRGQSENVSIYEIENVHIAIQVQEDQDQPGKKAVMGLVTGPVSGGLKIVARMGEAQIAAGEVDELGNFVISGLASGTYDFVISGSTESIQIAAFEIK